jgi:hypothetical protein
VNGFFYSPFGWPYDSPVFFYSTPGFYYRHPLGHGFAGRGSQGRGFAGHGFHGGVAAPRLASGSQGMVLLEADSTLAAVADSNANSD